MLLLEDRRFYVYVYLDPRKPGMYKYGKYEFDYEPFYVGRGCRDRMYAHLHPSSLKNNSHKNNKIRKILNINLKPIIIKIIENLTFKESIVNEFDVIYKIGRVKIRTGPLTNSTDGEKVVLVISQPKKLDKK